VFVAPGQINAEAVSGLGMPIFEMPVKTRPEVLGQAHIILFFSLIKSINPASSPGLVRDDLHLSFVLF